MNWFNKLLGKKEEVVQEETPAKTTEDERRAILEKEKQEATARGEAWVAVLDTQINPDNKWSKEFGTDTPEGRQIKQGVLGVFAARTFKKSDHVTLRDGSKISLAAYAARLTERMEKCDLFFNARAASSSILWILHTVTMANVPR